MRPNIEQTPVTPWESWEIEMATHVERCQDVRISIDGPKNACFELLRRFGRCSDAYV